MGLRWRPFAIFLASLAPFLARAGPCAADEKRIPPDLREPVAAAVARARAFLVSEQKPTGEWAYGLGDDGEAALGVPNHVAGQALTCLATLALVRAGAAGDDAAVRRALERLRARLDAPQQGPNPRDLRCVTYGAGCLLWMLSEVRPPGFRRAASHAALALSRGVLPDGHWTYLLPYVREEGGYASIVDNPARTARGDASNSQFAVLGLLAAERMGVHRGAGPWRLVQKAVREGANKDGGYTYLRDPSANATSQVSYRVGTEIHATNLYVASRRLGLAHAAAWADPHLQRALGWLKRNPPFVGSPRRWVAFDPVPPPGARGFEKPPYYELLTLERLGTFTSQEKLAGVEWYREGARLLLGRQQADGSWPAGTGTHGTQNAVLNTTFAVLFLTRALDDLPVDEGPISPRDLAEAIDVPEPLFGELIRRAVRDRAVAIEGEVVAYDRALVSLGVRALDAMVALLRDGPSDLVDPIDSLLASLTGRPRPEGDRAARVGDWSAWIAARRTTLRPNESGTGFAPSRPEDGGR